MTLYSGSVSGLGWFLDDEKEEKKMIEGSFILFVKNGDVSYEFNEKTGEYSFIDKDYKENYKNGLEALKDFLDWIDSSEISSEIVLTFKPKKKRKKG